MKLLTERNLSIDSVDAQIDSYIIEFEDKALKNKPSSSDDGDIEGAPPESPVSFEEGNNRVSKILRQNIRFLREADKEEEKNNTKNVKSKDSNLFDVGSEDGEDENIQFKINVNAPEKPNRKPENLDVDTFVANIARLINHADNLLSVKKVIYNRAMKFIEENYDEDTKNVAEMSIKTNFDVEVPSEEFGGYNKTAIEREY